MKKLSLFAEYGFLLLLGGFIYYNIEVIYRGYSHPSMFLVGGICFILIGLINEVINWDIPFLWQVLLGDIFVLIVEFIAGCILNLWLNLGVWDYSNLPLNIFGQICIPFALLWLPIVAVAIVVDDWVKYLLYEGQKPHYNFKLRKPESL